MGRIDFFRMYERWFKQVRAWTYLDIPKWVDIFEVPADEYYVRDMQVAQGVLSQLLGRARDVETLMAEPEYSFDLSRYVDLLEWLKEYYTSPQAGNGNEWRETLANWLANEMCILIQEAKDAAGKGI